MGYIVSFVVIVLETCAIILLCDTWLEKKPYRQYWLAVFASNVIPGCILVNTVLAGGVTLLKMAVMGTLFVVWSLFFWQGDFLPRVMLTLTALSLVNVTDYAVSGLLQILTGTPYRELMASPFYYLLAVSISKLSLLVLTYAICRASAASSRIDRNWKNWATLSLAPLALLALTLYMANSLQQHGALGEQLLMVAVLVGATTVLYLIKTTDADNAAQVTDLFQKQHQSLTQQNKAQSKVLHDETNLSLTLYNLLEKGQQQQAMAMLQQRLNRQGQVPQRVYIDHPMVDAILNEQYQQAHEQNIKFLAQFCSLEHLAMQPLDIAMLFCNLLDNARHACGACTGERRIVVQAVPSGKRYVRLTVYNTYDPTLPQKKAPEDPMKVAEHGYGKQIIQETLQKYHCSYSIQQKDGWYRVLTLLPCPQPPEIDE